jgi:hypothetical protein
VKAHNEAPWQYTQFAGVWKAHAIRPRNFYCEKCRAKTAAPADKCSGCGNPLQDVFKLLATR